MKSKMKVFNFPLGILFFFSIFHFTFFQLFLKQLKIPHFDSIRYSSRVGLEITNAQNIPVRRNCHFTPSSSSPPYFQTKLIFRTRLLFSSYSVDKLFFKLPSRLDEDIKLKHCSLEANANGLQ